jgi:hypothetical protein
LQLLKQLSPQLKNQLLKKQQGKRKSK